MIGVPSPNLNEILLGKCLLPWTEHAFVNFLTQHHCAENLEFIKDSDSYFSLYSQTAAPHLEQQSESCLAGLHWEWLMRLYVVIGAPRELNIPGPAREHLLNLSHRNLPPNPSELGETRQLCLDLLEESLASFSQSVDSTKLDDSSRSEDTRTTSYSLFKYLRVLLCYNRGA